MLTTANPERAAVVCQHCGLPRIGKFQWLAFSRDLRVAMAEANISLRALQAQTGVDQATIHRVAKHGKPVGVEAFLALWQFTYGDHLTEQETDNGRD